MLLFVHDGAVQGIIHYYWIPDDFYLQTNAFCINEATETALKCGFFCVGNYLCYKVHLGD